MSRGVQNVSVLPYCIILPMYNLKEYCNNSLKHQEVYGNTIDINHFQMLMALFLTFLADSNNSALFKFKIKIGSRRENDSPKDAKFMVPLKYLSSF